MDDLIRARARAARQEVEAELDIEAAWRRHNEDVLGPTTIPVGEPSSPSRWGWMLAAAAVLAIVVGGGALLLRDAPESVQSDVEGSTVPASTPPTSIKPIATAPVVVEPTTIPAPPATTAPSETSLSTQPAEPTTPEILPLDFFTTEPSQIARNCGDIGCTQLAIDAGGDTVSYDPTTRTLTRHSVPIVSATVPFDGDVWLLVAGPDDVVYLGTPTSVSDPVGDIVAVSLSASDSGRELQRWTGELDVSGDSELVPTPDGLVRVGCCGGDAVRPVVDATPLIGWVELSDITGPDVPDIHYGTDGTVEVDGQQWRVEPTGGPAVRGMPRIVATFDGGFQAVFASLEGDRYTLVRGMPDGTVEQWDVADYPTLLEPTGFVVFDDGEQFVRAALIGVSTKDVFPVEQVDGGALAAGNINEVIDAELPEWAGDPVTFAAAIAPPLQPNETRMIEYGPAEANTVVTVTTDGHYDDSVKATRLVFELEPTVSGLYHFVSGGWGVACQPGRGHEGFEGGLCV